MGAVVLGKEKDGKAAMLACRDYVVTLTALEADNVMWSAFLEARFAESTWPSPPRRVHS